MYQIRDRKQLISKNILMILIFRIFLNSIYQFEVKRFSFFYQFHLWLNFDFFSLILDYL